MAKLFFPFVASVLLAQAVYSQCGCNGILGNNIGLTGNNLGYAGNNLAFAGNNLALAGNNLGYGNNLGFGNNLAFAGNNFGVLGNGLDTYGNAGIFVVESASPNYNSPAGVVVTSENQIGGQVAVTGALPFLGSAYFGGDVASGGEGTLTYGAGPSVSLNGGGCGYGLGGAGVTGYGIGNSFGGASVINSGLGGASIINNGLLGGSSCGNGLYY